MAHTLQELESELARDIAATEAKLATLKNTLAFVRERSGAAARSVATLPEVKPIVNDGLISLDELQLTSNSGKPTFADEVAAVIKRLGSQEFTVVHIHVILEQMGIQIGGKYPRSRISMVLAKLCKDGVLTQTFHGSGNTPHKYKAVGVANES